MRKQALFPNALFDAAGNFGGSLAERPRGGGTDGRKARPRGDGFLANFFPFPRLPAAGILLAARCVAFCWKIEQK